jgi:hypothetical protein
VAVRGAGVRRLFFVWDNEAAKDGPLIVKWRKTELGAIEWAMGLNEGGVKEVDDGE